MFRTILARPLSLTLFVALLLPQTRCVNDIINDLGVPLPGSVSAQHLRNTVAESAFGGFITGATYYCTDYSGLCNQVGAEIMTGGLLVRDLAPQNLPITDRQWFSQDRLATCVDNVTHSTETQSYLYLRSNEQPGTSTATGAQGVSVQGMKDALPGAAVFAAGSAEDCFKG